MSAPTPEVVSKLQNILARADTPRGSTEAEALAAMAAARKLAVQHGIDLATIAVDSGKAPEIQAEAGYAGVHTKYERNFHIPALNVVRAACDVQWVMSSYWTPQCMRVITRIVFLGEPADVQMALKVWEWAQVAFPALYKQWRDQTGTKASWKAERSYYVGLSHGMIAANTKATEEATTGHRQEYALVLQSKETAIEALKLQVFQGPLKTLNTRVTKVDGAAYHAGHAKGKATKVVNGGALL